MRRVICVNTGTKYNQWHVDNLKHMIDNYSNLKYDKFEVITENRYDDDRGVFNKLLMFEKFTNGQNIYFDLDILIKGDCNHFLRKEFTLCLAHWRHAYHTPLNSSIMSWQGDYSGIHDKFIEQIDYNLLKYNKGIDQFIHENINNYKLYTIEDKFCSYQTILDEQDYVVYLFNQNYKEMLKNEWYRKYFKRLV